MNILAAILEALGIKAAGAGSQACVTLFWDEPKMPKSLIK